MSTLEPVPQASPWSTAPPPEVMRHLLQHLVEGLYTPQEVYANAQSCGIGEGVMRAGLVREQQAHEHALDMLATFEVFLDGLPAPVA